MHNTVNDRQTQQEQQTRQAIIASTRIGIIGGGQLGLMLCEAAQPMGFPAITVLDPIPHCPASVIAQQIVGNLKDGQAIRQLATQANVLTYEIEHINTAALKELQNEGTRIYPSPDALAIIQDKYRQKEFLAQHAIPVAPFISIEDAQDIERIAQEWGYPLVLKAKRDAYDGRGNARINAAADITPAMAKLAGRELYVEKCLTLAKELGVMIARNQRGELAAHPVVEMLHERDICQVVFAPAPIDFQLQQQAQQIALDAIGYLQGAGIFGVEMFLDSDGRLWLNEIAPRPHNLGHYSIEACETSQFTQHLNAVTNLKLTSTAMRYPAAVMINILGTRNGPAEPRWLHPIDQHNIFVHVYGKRETKIDRKMGHITVVGNDLDEVYQRAQEARAAFSI